MEFPTLGEPRSNTFSACVRKAPVATSLIRRLSREMWINNAYLKRHGLVSIKELWVAFHYSQ